MNIAVLVLLPAALLGLAATLAGFGLTQLPLGQTPAGSWAVGVWGLLGVALGAMLVEGFDLASRAKLHGLARWLGAATICTLLLPRALAMRADGEASGLLAVGLPIVWAALIGGALPWCVGVAARAGWHSWRASSAVLAAFALGAAAGAPLLIEGMVSASGLFLPATLALLLAALACFLLAPAQAAQPFATAGDRHPRAQRLPLHLAALGGGLVVLGWQASLRMLSAAHGDSLSLRAEATLGLALGAALASLVFALARRLPSAGVLTATAFLIAAAALGAAPRLVDAGLPDARFEQVLWMLVPLGMCGAMVLLGTGASTLTNLSAGGRLAVSLGALGLCAALAALFGPTLFTIDLVEGTSGVLGHAASAAAMVVLLIAFSKRSFAPDAVGTPVLRWSIGLLAILVTVSNRLAEPIELPWRTHADETALLRRVDGADGVATLVETREMGVRLVLDGWSELAGDAEARLGRRMGRLAAVMQPAASRALLLGRGAGHLLAGLSMTTPAQVDCVEPSEELLALDLETPFLPGLPARGGAPRVVSGAPRAWLDSHPRGYELIVGGLVHPGARGAGALLSRQQFGAMRAALTKDGVAVQWLALHRMGWPAFATVVNAFLDSFPDARLFVASLRGDVPLVALVGGLDRGLPAPATMDELLGASTAVDGLAAAVDVLDLYVADGWTLMTRFSDEPISTLERPLSELLSQDTRGDEAWLASTNLRRLADLSLPLDTSSLRSRPIDPKQDRQLGAELTARSAALTGLLIARAARNDLFAAAPGSLSDDERTGLQEELEYSLLAAWSAAPGHLDVRDGLLERASELARSERHRAAADLLHAAQGVLPDGRLGGVLGGVLLRLRLPDQALDVLAAARKRAPEDRTVLVNLGGALLMLGRDAEAQQAWIEARSVFAPARLPPLQRTALALLEAGEDLAAARAAAVVLRGAMPADDPWSAALERLLAKRSGEG